MHVGIAGLGLMGSAMARRLIDVGHRVSARQRNARAMALTMALSMRRQTVAVGTSVPSGARTSFLPPRRRIEIGTPVAKEGLSVPQYSRSRGGQKSSFTRPLLLPLRAAP